MNVLLFVTSLIMVMAAVTYARLETYRNFSVVQAEFKHFMDDTERGYINMAAEHWYATSSAKKPPTNGGNPPVHSSPNVPQKPSSPKGNRLLSFAYLIDPTKREKDPKKYAKIHLLAKKLIITLYKEQPFFKEMEQKKPDFVDGLLNALAVIHNFPKKLKPQEAKDLANTDLGDPEYNNFLYKILQRTITRPDKEIRESFSKEDRPARPLEEEEKGSDEEDSQDKESHEPEYTSPKGFYSLLDYITLKDAQKIRIYLAPKKMLEAIFDDPKVVQTVIETRKEIYKQVKGKKGMDNSEASKIFKNKFAPLSDPNFDDTILDFDVTKTDPSKYD
jgi:hypothetical protein